MKSGAVRPPLAVYAGGVPEILEAASALAIHDPGAALDSEPWLGEAIDADAAAGRFVVWGRSTVIDENTREPVLSRELFAALHERARLDAQWPVGNAGLLHVYGYLLSPVMTPFGRKHERWTRGELAALCGLPSSSFIPWASRRTLLERVTAAGQAVLDRHLCRTQDLGDVIAHIALTRTHGAAALAYALRTPTTGRRIVTMFPVADAAAILADIDSTAQRPRWNAILPGAGLTQT